MARTEEGRPLAELLGGLAGDISTLFRKEIQLAKAEASEKLSETMAGVVSLLIGTVLALGALGVLLTAVVSVLAAFFVSRNMDPTLANALAAAIVGVAVGVIAWIFASKGLNALKARNLNMNITAGSLSRDANIVKERL